MRKRYSSFLSRVNPISEARRYADCLEHGEAKTKAQVARVFGVSRPRVTQITKLLKLPAAIRQFLLDHDDSPAIRTYFSERRLRALTFLPNQTAVYERFQSMLSDACSRYRVGAGQDPQIQALLIAASTLKKDI